MVNLKYSKTLINDNLYLSAYLFHNFIPYNICEVLHWDEHYHQKNDTTCKLSGTFILNADT